MVVENVVWQILILAFLIEAVVQTLKPIWEPQARTVTYFVNQLVGLVMAVIVNVLAGLDIFTLLGVPLTIPVVGVILTGILMSRGAGVLHDLMKSLNLLKERLGEF